MPANQKPDVKIHVYQCRLILWIFVVIQRHGIILAAALHMKKNDIRLYCPLSIFCPTSEYLIYPEAVQSPVKIGFKEMQNYYLNVWVGWDSQYSAYSFSRWFCKPQSLKRYLNLKVPRHHFLILFFIRTQGQFSQSLGTEVWCACLTFCLPSHPYTCI